MDFLGSTTPQTIIGDITDAVQTTGDALWPFLFFLGIPIAFVVARFLTSWIRGIIGRAR